jgi:probable O-glycosylation ligase (exosortase A-associated)
MRDLFFITIFIGSIPFILRSPRVGVLMWVWISVANPHRESFGWIMTFPVLDLIAGATLVSVVLNMKQLHVPKDDGIFRLLIVFFIWCTLTTIFSVYPESAWIKWEKFAKSFLIVFLIIFTHTTRRHVYALVWVLVLSVGFTGIKSGLFTILTAGNYRVWGPLGTWWGDNNHVSAVMLMFFPILIALAVSWKVAAYRYMTLFAAFLYFVTIFGTHSRGGLVGLVGVYMMYALRTKKLFKSLAGAAVIVGVALVFMPSHWLNRMESIEGHEDQSSQTRLVQWAYAIDIANERPFFGNGFDGNFDPYYQTLFLADEIEENRGRAMHSVYFELLSEQGYIGLLIFLMIGASALRASNKYKLSKSEVVSSANSDDRTWIKKLAYSLQFGMAGYAANGATINVAYLDIYYFLIALLVCIGVVIRNEEKTASKAVS